MDNIIPLLDNIIPLFRAASTSYEVMVLEPSCYSTMTQAVTALRANKVLILKLDKLDKEQAQQILDFICGSAYAISSQLAKVSETVFLFVPHGMQLQDRLEEEHSSF